MNDLEKQALVRIKKSAIDSLLSDADKLKFGLFPDGTLDDRGIENLPTDEEINTAYEAKKAEYDALQYQRDRQYPELGEQLDLLFHDMTAGKGTKSGEWYKAIAKVKADNPKG